MCNDRHARVKVESLVKKSTPNLTSGFGDPLPSLYVGHEEELVSLTYRSCHFICPSLSSHIISGEKILDTALHGYDAPSRRQLIATSVCSSPVAWPVFLVCGRF